MDTPRYNLIDEAWIPVADRGKSSPRPWGCFYFSPVCRCGRRVFPTPVGVFLRSSGVLRIRRSLPHARGGVSGYTAQAARSAVSSPRPWGCFLMRHEGSRKDKVFPTPVGVFPVGS